MTVELMTFVLLMASTAVGQCPSSMIGAKKTTSGSSPACSCASTRFEPVNVVCEGGASLGEALKELSQLKGTPIDSLVISDTPAGQMLPAFAFEELTVKRLVLRNNGFSDLHPHAFGQAMIDSVQEVEIADNALGQIPQGGLSTLKNLQSLTLSKVGIVSMVSHAFAHYAGRQTLRRIDLSNNRLQSLMDDAFYGLDNLVELSLDKNLLSRLPTGALRSLHKLEDLSLGANRIDQLLPNQLPFPNLKSLSIEVNKLKGLEPEVFAHNSQLLYLYMSSNEFTQFDPNAFYHLRRLKVLAMGDNVGVKAIGPNAFAFLPDLVRLDLAGCSIMEIAADAFAATRNIQVISLQENKIRSIVAGTFRSLENLKSLNLKSNEISSIDGRAFSRLGSLKHLDVSKNRITTLEPDTFFGTFTPSDPATARFLYIHGNPWNCDDTLDWLVNWLRANEDIAIDEAGFEPTKCWKPREQQNRLLRDPSRPGIKSHLPEKKSEKRMKPRVNVSRGSLLQTEKARRGGGMTTFVIILGAIVAIFAIAAAVLMAVRYLAGKSRRRRRRRDDEARRLGSTLGSSYRSSAFSSTAPGGASYPCTADVGMGSLGYRSMAPTAGHQTEQQGYYLSRPWYYWF